MPVRRMERPARVWVVAGAPGSGKSTVADELLARLDPTPALLDKDTLFSGFVPEVLAAYGRPHGEREGSWYDEHIKVHEYGGMTGSARQIRGHGCPVMLVAPFTGQIRDPGQWRDWVVALGGEPVTLIWVRSSPEILRHRIVTRRTARDGGKLAAFDTFLARMLPGVPPPVAHLEVDNTGDRESLAAAVARMDLTVLDDLAGPGRAARFRENV
jgi:predicted kinase